MKAPKLTETCGLGSTYTVWFVLPWVCNWQPCNSKKFVSLPDNGSSRHESAYMIAEKIFSVPWITCCSIRRSWNVSCRRASSCLLQRKLKTTSFLRSSINLSKYCDLPVTSLAVLFWIHSLLGSWIGPAMTLQPLEVLACFPLMHTPEGQQYYCYLPMPGWSRSPNLSGWRWCCFFT